MNARQLESLLRQFGFEFISQKGSHRKWRHVQLRIQVIVPEHKGRDIPLGTLLAILQESQIPESEWRG
jgi:predicted RNA binding protein YcfA (HicA-like mRNA interferase family)